MEASSKMEARQAIENMVARDGVEPPTPAFSASYRIGEVVWNQQM